jgi:hypothetical protein
MKKTLLYHILFFCLILSLKTYSQEQILVQKEWLSSTGNLDTIPYSATAMDSHGNLIVVGNTPKNNKRYTPNKNFSLRP